MPAWRTNPLPPRSGAYCRQPILRRRRPAGRRPTPSAPWEFLWFGDGSLLNQTGPKRPPSPSSMKPWPGATGRERIPSGAARPWGAARGGGGGGRGGGGRGGRTPRGGGGDPDWMQIIGVVGDMRAIGLDAEPRPELYMPYWHW